MPSESERAMEGVRIAMQGLQQETKHDQNMTRYMVKFRSPKELHIYYSRRSELSFVKKLGLWVMNWRRESRRDAMYAPFHI
jgi:hypothetical protein